jgi:NitT/TauT family transport system ATP-binding protein
LDLRGISKRFHAATGGSGLAINDITASIQRGEFVAVVGLSGCGKSTLLTIAAGLLEATEGNVLFQGRPLTGPPRQMIFLFQQYTKSIFPWKTVRKNVAFGLANRERLPRALLHARCAEAVRRVGLTGYEHYYPWQLSGGMQQRVALARALEREPEVLLMDEPFSAVDAMTRAELQDLILALYRDLGLTVLFVTHDIDEAVYLSTRVLVMTRAPGRIVEDIPVDLPYPRDQLTTKASARFLECRGLIYKAVQREKALLAARAAP